MAKTPLTLLVVAVLVLSIPMPAWAYIGPGSGLSAIGAAFALVASVFVAIVGFVWYPLKRVWRKITGSRRTTAAETR